MKMKNIQTIAALTFLAILVVVGGYLVFKKNNVPMKTYANTSYGVAFEYPSSYDLTETTVTEGQPGTIVTLTDKGVEIPVNGEGPTAITLGMYEGTGTGAVGNQDPLLNWIRTSPYSNFTLSKQSDPGLTTIADQDARLYTWDGLYQGTTLVTIHNGNILIWSVTYDGESDMKKREDFSDIIANIRLTEKGVATSTPVTNK
jgi:hypothetical protein